MSTFDILKSRFEAVVEKHGCVLDSDYFEICSGVADHAVLNRLAHWLLSSGVPLKKNIGPQYKRELMRRIKHPNVRDVVDTKDRTHKNTDKFQESKKDATLNFNDKIDDKKEKDFNRDFMPPWKRMRITLEEPPKIVGFKLLQFINDNPDVMELAASVGLYAFLGDDYNMTPEELREYIMEFSVHKAPVPGVAYLNAEDFDAEEFSYLQGANIGDKGTLQRMLGAIDDKRLLYKILNAVERGYFTAGDADVASPAAPKLEQPSEFAFEDTGDAPLDLAEPTPLGTKKSSVASKHVVKDSSVVAFDNGACFTVDTASTPAQKAAGLEPYESLPESRGLYFPFDETSLVTFHMGKVKFPIDIIFLSERPHGMEVTNIVHEAQPGATDHWSSPKTSAVLEVVGGTCKKLSIEVGSFCKHLAKDQLRTAQSTMNPANLGVAYFSKMQLGEEIDAYGLAQAVHIEPITAEQVLNKLVGVGLAYKDGKWYGPTNKPEDILDQWRGLAL
jgi:uncharacterized membrane protein (UPF0127 family)